ncbi:hypothetical protein SILAB01_02271 [Lacticaseibacillus paracasei]|uniref:DUF1642 domain-containing protein n=1 Tax=Lacticaseibacillus paracasei TaxID=1597 RepID=UPI000914D6D7|nr:DUF1642 domain-containing protein [Lacticaseibacillus paracasei]GAV18375.1 hypothetical protein SILAB01_02271 [Lacticaseibacillus paracasei]
MTGNETKRDVLEKLAECYAEVYDAYTDETGSPYYCDDEPNYLDEYDAALPDDLPVIPKAVGEWLKNCKHDECDLVDAIVSSVNSIITSRRVMRWMEDHFETFVLAWLLGVWRVEETGEIVKLEAEK